METQAATPAEVAPSDPWSLAAYDDGVFVFRQDEPGWWVHLTTRPTACLDEKLRHAREVREALNRVYRTTPPRA